MAPTSDPRHPLNVVFCFDDYFWAPAYAAMRSVAIATPRRADLTFHLCHWQLRPEHRTDLDRIVAEFGARVNHYALETDPAVATRLAGLPATRAFPPFVYARLMLDRILPPRVTRSARTGPGTSSSATPTGGSPRRRSPASTRRRWSASRRRSGRRRCGRATR